MDGSSNLLSHTVVFDLDTAEMPGVPCFSEDTTRSVFARNVTNYMKSRTVCGLVFLLICSEIHPSGIRPIPAPEFLVASRFMQRGT